MAYTPGFEYDIFISYVHYDNESETVDGDGWVSQFYKYLDTKLKKHDATIKIWGDATNLDRSELFNKAIKEAIEKSALIICLCSRRYLKSAYCKKELDLFFTKIETEKIGLEVGNFSRVIPVLISNINHRQWPEKLRGTNGFAFHDAKSKEDYGDPLNIETSKFGDQMKKLRNSLVHILEDLKNKLTVGEETSQTIEQKKEDDSFTIYLGEVDDSLRDRRDGIISELNNKGYQVIIGDASTAEASIHQKITEEAIEKAHLAVHLLGEFPGKMIAGDQDSRYIQKQFEIGLESKTPQLVWLAEDLKVSTIENNDHQNFVQSLESGKTPTKKYEFIRANEGDLVKIILDHALQLKTKREKELSKQGLDDKGQLRVLLDTHIDDFSYAFNLRKSLLENDIKLIFNPEDGDPQENIELLYENISEAQKFIFLYGKEENNDWIDVRVKNTMKKLMEYDRYDQDIFLYMTPPPKDPGSVRIAQSPLVKVIDNSSAQKTGNGMLELLVTELKASIQ